MRLILAALLMVAGLLAMNLGPIILEILRMSMMDRMPGRDTSVLITLSPLGLLACVWGDSKVATLALGCVWQIILATVMVLIAWAVSRRGSTTRVPPVREDAVAAQQAR
jgi:hypothetical protein